MDDQTQCLDLLRLQLHRFFSRMDLTPGKFSDFIFFLTNISALSGVKLNVPMFLHFQILVILFPLYFSNLCINRQPRAGFRCNLSLEVFLKIS